MLLSGLRRSEMWKARNAGSHLLVNPSKSALSVQLAAVAVVVVAAAALQVPRIRSFAAPQTPGAARDCTWDHLHALVHCQAPELSMLACRLKI